MVRWMRRHHPLGGSMKVAWYTTIAVSTCLATCARPSQDMRCCAQRAAASRTRACSLEKVTVRAASVSRLMWMPRWRTGSSGGGKCTRHTLHTRVSGSRVDWSPNIMPLHLPSESTALVAPQKSATGPSTAAAASAGPLTWRQASSAWKWTMGAGTTPGSSSGRHNALRCRPPQRCGERLRGDGVEHDAQRAALLHAAPQRERRRVEAVEGHLGGAPRQQQLHPAHSTGREAHAAHHLIHPRAVHPVVGLLKVEEDQGAGCAAAAQVVYCLKLRQHVVADPAAGQEGRLRGVDDRQQGAGKAGRHDSGQQAVVRS